MYFGDLDFHVDFSFGTFDIDYIIVYDYEMFDYDIVDVET